MVATKNNSWSLLPPPMSRLGCLADRRGCRKNPQSLQWLLFRHGKFRLATNSSFLRTVDVFRALLRHTIAPSSVGQEFWKFLQLYFSDALQLHGDPTHLQSLFLVPHNSEWTTFTENLLNMSEAVLGDLTEKMSTHACNWITRLLLPSMFLSPFLCEGLR